MPHYLSDEELKRTAPAELGSFRSPVPTQIVSNGEYNPLPQTAEQRQRRGADQGARRRLGPQHGMSRRAFLASSAGMAAAFLAMNEVFGPVFDVRRAEAQTPGVADERAKALAGQFIIDVQTHFVRDDFNQDGLLGSPSTPRSTGTRRWPANHLPRYKFENYVKEIFVDSDTKVALLSGAPFDDPTLGSAEQRSDRRGARRPSTRSPARAACSPTPCSRPRSRAGSRRSTGRIAELKPDSWKGYTVGDPLFPSKLDSYWRMDDEKLVYPFYEKIAKSGITTVCIHKGLLPADYEKSGPILAVHHGLATWARRRRTGRRSTSSSTTRALRPFLEPPDAALAEFEQTGRIEWVTDLAEIPAKFGVKNVYGELGTAFATSAVANPRFAAAFSARWSKGMGADHVVWGTRLGLVRLAAVADRGAPPARDPRGHAEEARLRAAGRRRRPGQERDLRGQRRAALQGRPQGRAGRDHHGQDRRDQGRVRRHGRRCGATRATATCTGLRGKGARLASE